METGLDYLVLTIKVSETVLTFQNNILIGEFDCIASVASAHLTIICIKAKNKFHLHADFFFYFSGSQFKSGLDTGLLDFQQLF